MEIIELKTTGPSFIDCIVQPSSCCVEFVRVLGGILGWDPVHTTCIFFERSYKNIVKIIQLGLDKEFCLCLIRMMIL